MRKVMKWTQENSYGFVKYGWNEYKLGNWYNAVGDGYNTATQRNEALKEWIADNNGNVEIVKPK